VGTFCSSFRNSHTRRHPIDGHFAEPSLDDLEQHPLSGRLREVRHRPLLATFAAIN
jgi:hypothetical protein